MGGSYDDYLQYIAAIAVKLHAIFPKKDTKKCNI